MKRIENWLKRRTIVGLMLIQGFSVVLGSSVNLWISNVDISFGIFIISQVFIYKCIREAMRRDKLVQSWGSNKMFIAKSKGM